MAVITGTSGADTTTGGNDTITLLDISPGVSGFPTDDADTIFGSSDTILGNDTDGVDDGDDSIDGAGGDDLLYGEGGDDTLSGGLGEDTLNGGDGSDTADYSYSNSNTLEIDLTAPSGEPGDSTGLADFGSTEEPLLFIENVVGSNGDNIIIGDDDDNVLDGADGEDSILAGGGDDTVIGGKGEDLYLDGGDGDNDTLDWSQADTDNNVSNSNAFILEQNLILDGYWRVFHNESIYVEMQNFENIIGSNFAGDDIRGDDNPNVLSGLAGGDQIHGEGGDDTLLGGTSSDALVGGYGDDEINGGTGNDLIDYFYVDNTDPTEVGRLIDLENRSVMKVDGSSGDTDTLTFQTFGSNTFTSVERARGSKLDDVILGDFNQSNTLQGHEGDDLINPNWGTNTLFGDGGNDTFAFGLSADGTNTIRDFGLGKDVIDLSVLGANSGNVNFDSDDGDTLITVDGNDDLTIRVSDTDTSGFDLSELDSGIINSLDGLYMSFNDMYTFEEQVPSYTWFYGCWATTIGSMVAWWDMHGYPDLFDAEGWEQLKDMQDVVYSAEAAANNPSDVPQLDGFVDQSPWLDTQEQIYDRDWLAKYGQQRADEPGPVPELTSIAGFGSYAVGSLLPINMDKDDVIPAYEGYTDFRGYDFDGGVRYRMLGDDFDQDEIWDILVSEIAAGRPAQAFLATGSEVDHNVPIFGVAEHNGERWFQHYNHSSTHSVIWGDNEDPIWHKFSDLTEVNSWGLHSLYFIKPEGLNIDGSDFDTVAFGNGGDDTIDGNGGDNIIYGGFDDGFPDEEHRGIGHDSLSGGSGDDTLIGGFGHDTLSGDSGTDFLDGGDGSDTADYSYSNSNSLVIDLSAPNGDGLDPTGLATFTSSGVTEVLRSIENAVGSNGDNTITGDDGDNFLDGAGGDDLIEGGDGDDTLSGGTGSDTFDGGDGNDYVDYSYTGSNALVVNLGTSSAIFTSSGTEESFLNNSIENIIGGSGDNVLIGDFQDNVIDGGDGDDEINGGDGNDTLLGGDGSDAIDGGNDNDLIEGGSGGDDLFGGAGNDTLSGGSGSDNFDGGADDDTIDFSYTDSNSLEINLATGFATFTSSGSTEALTNIENVLGGLGDNEIVGDDNANVLDGNGGTDTISGGGGDDTINAGVGDEDDDDSVIIRAILNGDGGDDRMISQGGDTQFNGGSGNDTFIASSGQDGFDGGDDFDLVDFTYSTSNSLVIDLAGTTAGLSTGVAYFGTYDPASLDNEVLADMEAAIGSNGDTEIYGTSGANNLDGAAGDDVLAGGAGSDTLSGGLENDTFIYETGDDDDIITDFNVDGVDQVDARGAGFVTNDDFVDLASDAGDPGVIDDGDEANGITVTADGADLLMDFGGGDTLRFENTTQLTASDFVLDAAVTLTEEEREGGEQLTGTKTVVETDDGVVTVENEDEAVDFVENTELV